MLFIDITKKTSVNNLKWIFIVFKLSRLFFQYVTSSILIVLMSLVEFPCDCLFSCKHHIDARCKKSIRCYFSPYITAWVDSYQSSPPDHFYDDEHGCPWVLVEKDKWFRYVSDINSHHVFGMISLHSRHRTKLWHAQSQEQPHTSDHIYVYTYLVYYSWKL